MHFRWLSLLLAVCSLVGTRGDTRQTDVPGLRSGILFTPRGPLVLATGEWTVVTRLQSHGLRKQAQSIRHHFNQISTAISSFPDVETSQHWPTNEQLSNHSDQVVRVGNTFRRREIHRRKDVRANIVKMWERERTWMSNELTIAEEEIDKMQMQMRVNRKRRGLLPFMGDALKWAFGTSTEADTRKLHKQIKEVTVGAGKLHHMIELQTTILGSLREGQEVNRANIQSLANETQRMFRTIINSQAVALWARITTNRHLRQEQDFSRMVASAIRTMTAAVLTHRQEVHSLSEAISHTQRGEVTSAILPPKLVEAALLDIKKKLPEGWTYAASNPARAADLYQTFRLVALAIADGWEIHISIPLRYQPYGKFELYKVTPIPSHFIRLHRRPRHSSRSGIFRHL